YHNSVQVLPAQCSDHNPIFVTCSSSDARKAHRPCIFRYEAAWGNREECRFIVQQAWLLSSHLRPKSIASQEGLKFCSEKLKTWSRKAFQNHTKKLSNKRECLRRMQETNTGHSNVQIHQIQAEIDKLLEDEELKWRQRAKQRWLQEGDRNTKYFHQCASHRKLINTIKSVANEE
ncbi:hypothetical protein I3842_11G085000, partial [Carya illinoinensis]